MNSTAQHSVHPIPDKVRRGHTGTARDLLSKSCRCGGGTLTCTATNAVRRKRRSAHALRAVRQFAWLEFGSIKMALSGPTHQYPAESMRGITPAVGPH